MEDVCIVNLDDLNCDGTISCPYCNKGKQYLYSASGMVSQNCDRCHRMVLWDFDHKVAYKARVRKFAS